MTIKKKLSHSIVVGASDSTDEADIYCDGKDDQIEINKASQDLEAAMMSDNDPMKKTLLHQMNTLRNAWDDFVKELAKATGLWWLMTKFESWLKRAWGRLF